MARDEVTDTDQQNSEPVSDAEQGGDGGQAGRAGRAKAAKATKAAKSTKSAASKKAPAKPAGTKKSAGTKQATSKAAGANQATTKKATPKKAAASASEPAKPDSAEPAEPADSAEPAKPSSAKAAPGKATPANAAAAKASSAKASSAKAGAAKASSAKSDAKQADAKSDRSTESATPKRAAKKKARQSGTGAAAAQVRTVMQHRHRRLGFAMTAALGVELAGVAGLIIAGLLSWEWGERLWGRTDGAGITLQAATAVTVLALVLAWLVRSYPVRMAARTVALLAAAVVLIGAVATVWQAELGGRGPGGILAAIAALLVAIGAVGWLVGLNRLRVLFPFGLENARSSGFGNLPAVRRAQWVGGPSGAVGGIAVVAGALLVAPGMVTTEDANTATALSLSGEVPAAGGDPAWELELPGTASSAAWATSGGVIIAEDQGVRAVDPADGETRWHWRDEAYLRSGGVVTDGGDTVVLALTYDGEETGRDRVVALDTATGEVRWDIHDDGLAAAMATFAVEPEDADWFVAIEQAVGADGAAGAPSLRAVGSDDGQTRWEAAADEGCNLTGLEPAAGTVVTVQECAGGEPADPEDPEAAAAGDCLVTSVEPADGSAAWSWPTEDAGPESALGCQVSPTPELVFVTYEADGQPAAAALDPATGEELWTDAESADGLTNAAVVGDAVVGTEFAEDGAGGGEGTLVIRDAADGEVQERTALPAGQPIEAVPTRPGFVAISLFRAETSEVVLVEAEVAEATVGSEVSVASGPPGSTVRRVSIGVAPETLAVETLLAAGEQGQEEYTLVVDGWASSSDQ